MTGPAYFTGGMNVAKNFDWVQAFILQAGDLPVDLTGSVLRMIIRKHDTDHEALVSVTSEDGTIEITDPLAGAFTVLISRDKLKRLYPGNYVSDLVRLRPDGFQERLWDATPVAVVEGVTR